MILSIILLILLSNNINACTTFAIGRRATVDGSVLATHSNDGEGDTDPRLVRVPAQDFPPDSMRPIWASPESYPRYVGYTRAVEEYYPEHCQGSDVMCEEFQPIGYIPQVNHTYSYFEQTYGTMNEKQVALQESTCSSVYTASSVAVGGKALLSIDQLSQIAMERAGTAREAITTMGELAEKYGFYGPSSNFEGGAESLIVTDPNEAWVFHVLADASGASAIWVAARVPDDSVAVVANMFSVREVDLNDPENFLGRADMWELAEKGGLYDPGDPMDFTATFSDGEYSHKYYSGRRMWGVFHLLAPSANLPAEYGNLKYDSPYPFSVRVDSLVDPQDAMKVMRYWYNETIYTTGEGSGLASGPFGTPDRYSGARAAFVNGSWERTIALYRTSDSSVVQSRNWLPNAIGGVLWFGSAAAHSTAYVPLMVGSMLHSPACLNSGWQGVYDLSSSFWAHRRVLNLAQIKFDYMFRHISAVQKSLESSSQKLIDHISDQYKMNAVLAVENHVETEDKLIITRALEENAEKARDKFLQLFDFLLFTYADGWINIWSPNDEEFLTGGPGYPIWWLEAVGYEDGPEPINEGSRQQKEFQQKAQELQKIKLNRAIKAQERKSFDDISFLMKGVERSVETSLRSCINRCDVFNDAEYKQCVKQCNSKDYEHL